MRKAPLLGLSASAILGVALFAVLADDDRLTSIEANRQPLVSAAEPIASVDSSSSTTTSPPSTVQDLHADALAIAEWHVVTTTIAAPPPSDASAKAPGQSPSPPTTKPRAVSAPTTEAPPATEPPPPTTAPPSSQAGPSPEFESQFASRINDYRSGNGLSGLSRDGSLDARARSWAERMADNGGLSHSSLGSLLPPWSAAAENVGMGGSVKGIFGALVGSSGHKANMLGDYTHLGVGVWVDSGGTIWTAHVFTR